MRRKRRLPGSNIRKEFDCLLINLSSVSDPKSLSRSLDVDREHLGKERGRDGGERERGRREGEREERGREREERGREGRGETDIHPSIPGFLSGLRGAFLPPLKMVLPPDLKPIFTMHVL